MLSDILEAFQYANLRNVILTPFIKIEINYFAWCLKLLARAEYRFV